MSDAPTYYSFDAETGLYTGSRIAAIDPLETRMAGAPIYLRPGALDVTTAPPDLAAKQAVVWDGTQWGIVADHRGETWFDADGSEIEIVAVGDPAAHGLVAEPPPRALSADDVRAEAQRRICVLLGAPDIRSCMIKQLNALMRGNELTDKYARGETLTAEEEAEASMLRDLAAVVKAIRAASNAMESDPPDDYTANARWP